jgi:hypothetical protein
LWPAVLAFVVAAATVGCTATNAGEDTGAEPAVVRSIQGSKVGTVILTADAANRIGLRTTPVQLMRDGGGTGSGGVTAVPLAAVLYDKDGRSWVYVSSAPLTFVRKPIDILRVDGDTALLHAGPPAGTPVVTVGGAELLGTEYAVSGE